MTPPVRLRLLPRTYGDCCEGTPMTGTLEDRLAGRVQCQVLACRKNLLAVEGTAVPGRRHNGRSPEWTVSGENPSAMAPSCALDVANQGRHTCAQIAEIVATPEHRRRVQQEVRAAAHKLVKALVEMGVKVDELLAVLNEEEARAEPAAKAQCGNH